MIKHIVVWKLYDFAAGMSKKDNALKMKQWLKDLKSKIPEIRKLEVGINFNDSDDAYDIILYSEFKDKASLEIYQNHPEHAQFKERIKHIRSEKKVVDYEI
jgi:quinol monooxygenase YgiN